MRLFLLMADQERPHGLFSASPGSQQGLELLHAPPDPARRRGTLQNEGEMFFLELVFASTPALVPLLQESPYTKDKCDLVLFDIITHSPGKSASGWQDPGNLRFAMSCAMKL